MLIKVRQCSSTWRNVVGMPFEHPLAREIAVIVVIKLVVIAAIGFYFFGPATKARIDEDSVAKAVLERSQPAVSNSNNRSAK